MSRPKDIQQDVWDKAMSFLEAAPMVSIPCASDDRCHLINDPQTAIARAILAAKAEEREAIAQMADALADLFDGHAMRCAEEMDIVEARGAESAVRKFAAELRGES